MLAEIITIGNEILSGKTVDTNSSYIAQKLRKVGVQPRFMSTISDDENSIVSSLDLALSRVDIVLITGGLGPTHDDITKYTLAKYFDSELYRDEDLLDRLKAYFQLRGKSVDALNHTQADFPNKALKLDNDRGTATGMAFEKEGKWVFSMPGVPYEMKQMMDNGVTNILVDKLNVIAFKNKDIQTIGIPESKMAAALAHLKLDEREDLSFAYLPKLGRVTLRIYYREDYDSNKLSAIVDEVRSALSDYIFDEEGLEINEKIGVLLKEKNATLAVAESCTGGYLGHLITVVSGSSAYFKGGVLAYSNEVKMQELNVQSSTLEKYGAVSEQTVFEMAVNLRKKYDVDYAISISGIAGPDGGTEEKPVGTVCIGISSAKETITRTYFYYKVRQLNIESSATHALRLLWKYFLK